MRSERSTFRVLTSSSDVITSSRHHVITFAAKLASCFGPQLHSSHAFPAQHLSIYWPPARLRRPVFGQCVLISSDSLASPMPLTA